MGLFGFFKKKPIELEVESEEISFGDIGKWIESKDKSLKGIEDETLEKIGGMLDEFYVSLGEKLEIIEGIDIESKKEHGRVKLLVRQGLENYITSVRNLLRDLGGIDKKDLAKFVQEIGKIFVLFEKSSAKFYERATYLIGDEMAAVRNEIRRFNNELAEMFEGDGSSIKDLKRVMDVKLKLEEFEKLRKNFEEVGSEIELQDKKIERDKKDVEKLMAEVEKIKKSSEYVANLKGREEVKVLQGYLDREIVRLKELIDFKKLTSIIHSNEREMKIVKDYKEHFVLEFSRDGGERILDLLAASNMKNAMIESQVSLIGEKKSELDEKQGKIGLDSTIIMLEDVKKIEDEIDGMETGKVKVKRRLEEFDLKLQGLKNGLIKLVEDFGIEVV